VPRRRTTRKKDQYDDCKLERRKKRGRGRRPLFVCIGNKGPKEKREKVGKKAKEGTPA